RPARACPRSSTISAAASASPRDCCRCRTIRCARGCTPPKAGSIFRIISCGCAARRSSIDSNSPAPAMPGRSLDYSRHSLTRNFLDAYIADEEDAAAVAGLDVPVVLTRTLMQSLADREALARAVLAATERVRK